MNAPTSLIPLVEANPVMVLVDSEKFDRFYEEIAREVASHVPDLETDKGRKAIASLAYKVARTKTAIDDAGKTLTEDKRSEIKAVDDARKGIRERLDALRDKARLPLTEWEAVEEERAAKAAAMLSDIKGYAFVSLSDTSETVAVRLDMCRAISLPEAQFKESLPLAKAALANAIDALDAARVRLVREEGDRAELARLRAAEEERQRAEAERRTEADRQAAAERAEAARVEAETKAKADEEARIAVAAKTAETAATAAAEKAAREASEAREREHAQALAAEKRRADEAEAARKAEADRVAREVAETAKREANRAHRGKIMLAAKTAIMGHGVGEATAKAIVLAIGAGEIPNVSIQF